jgi:hypothetical protein
MPYRSRIGHYTSLMGCKCDSWAQQGKEHSGPSLPSSHFRYHCFCLRIYLCTFGEIWELLIQLLGLLCLTPDLAAASRPTTRKRHTLVADCCRCLFISSDYPLLLKPSCSLLEVLVEEWLHAGSASIDSSNPTQPSYEIVDHNHLARQRD